MSFNPFGGFPSTLSAIPHFAVGKFQQPQDASSFLSIPSSQGGLQIAVTAVDGGSAGAHLGHVNGNGHGPTSGQLQIQNQMLNNLLGKSAQNEVFIKVEHELEENERFHQSNHDKNGGGGNNIQQEMGSLNDYLSRFSGPPTFPVSFQPMYKYPGDLVQIQNQNDDQNLMTDHSSSVMTPEQPQVTTVLCLIFVKDWMSNVL